MPAANAAAASPPAVNASARGISVAIRRMHATIAEKATEAAEARADADALVTEVAELRRLLARANARLAGAGLRQVQLDDDDDREEGEGLEGKIHRVNPDFGSTLTASSMDSQSKCWVNWKIMGQPFEFQVSAADTMRWPPPQCPPNPPMRAAAAAASSAAPVARCSSLC